MARGAEAAHGSNLLYEIKGRRAVRADPSPVAGAGNTEGTSARPPEGARGHSAWRDSSVLRGLRARGFPGVPAVPASALHGKEGVDDYSRSELFAKATHAHLGDDTGRSNHARAGSGT
jgi:hypothetical protein